MVIHTIGVVPVGEGVGIKISESDVGRLEVFDGDEKEKVDEDV